ncbi:hypothetical protein GCM10023217_27340 [Gordonia alkaliphila]|uniref:Uncharacterized protein n=1 Tax=Gordonia alkaliphila TaxID=1053547 RepID=A0ABP8ZEP4_9ACTN
MTLTDGPSGAARSPPQAATAVTASNASSAPPSIRARTCPLLPKPRPPSHIPHDDGLLPAERYSGPPGLSGHPRMSDWTHPLPSPVTWCTMESAACFTNGYAAPAAPPLRGRTTTGLADPREAAR